MGVWNIKAQRAEVEHRWRESRGAVSAEGVHLSTEGGVWCPLPRKFFDFRSPNGDCWCILVFFSTIQRPVLHAKLVLLGL